MPDKREWVVRQWLWCHVPSRALKAGSTLPPLATSTAFITLVSSEGKASINVASACAWGLIGLGGFGGGADCSSSLKLTFFGAGCDTGGGASDGALVGWRASSSKSGSFAVVGDSAPEGKSLVRISQSERY